MAPRTLPSLPSDGTRGGKLLGLSPSLPLRGEHDPLLAAKNLQERQRIKAKGKVLVPSPMTSKAPPSGGGGFSKSSGSGIGWGLPSRVSNTPAGSAGPLSWIAPSASSRALFTYSAPFHTLAHRTDAYLPPAADLARVRPNSCRRTGICR